MNAQPPLLHTVTVEVNLGSSAPGDSVLVALLGRLTPTGAWLREGEGLIGLGQAASAAASGPRRFPELAQWWASVSWNPNEGTTPALSPLSPVAFTSVAFSAESDYSSRLIVPELLISHREGRTHLLMISAEPHEAVPGTADVDAVLARHGLRLKAGDPLPELVAEGSAVPQLPKTSVEPGTHSERQYMNAVTAGLSAIAEGTVEKLVLARDVAVRAAAPVHTGALLARLAQDYSECWTYYVHSTSAAARAVLGATPEMLVRLRGDRVSSRVLAGTVDRSWSPQEAEDRLLRDAKQHREHDLAVQSLVEQLAPLTESLQSPADPRVLQLPNVYHLASDVTGQLTRNDDGALPGPLQVAERAHPTAAVCGTPTREAGQLLQMLEGLDRGPFAGPVGWMDTRGNADFGIALRGAVAEDTGGPAQCPTQFRLYAGCGIVANSVPEDELAETRAKLRPMLAALGLQ
ncbi:isochorismate synthase [Nesterenkonia flava]|uniref:isochorismate synthase n=1 Tax=Nesterenkonia flava TaxID=469799 RepID=A0ABU1FS80_9MICC|nr:isochorismate synthase [Nesterenkonia flava]MDR5711182.1 isochorismate synthase [Nesterenkonia flava]